MAVSSVHTGFREDRSNGWLGVRYQGDLVGRFNNSSYDLRLTGGNGLTVDSGGVTVTAGGVTVTAGGQTITAGDLVVTAGNYRGGPVNAFATTEPTQSVVLEAGTAPAGAVTTSSGIFASATVLRKIIADGTASNVET